MTTLTYIMVALAFIAVMAYLFYIAFFDELKYINRKK